MHCSAGGRRWGVAAASVSRNSGLSALIKRDDDLVGTDQAKILADHFLAQVGIGLLRVEQGRSMLAAGRAPPRGWQARPGVAAGRGDSRPRRAFRWVRQWHGRRKCRRRSTPAPATPRGGSSPSSSWPLPCRYKNQKSALRIKRFVRADIQFLDRRSARHNALNRLAPPRSAAVGCTWRCGRSAPGCRS